VIPITGSILAFGLFTVLFAMLFKLLPDKRIPWKNVWVGAMGSSLLFGFARYVLTFYFLHSPIVSLDSAS
jgi:membrane protein